MIAGCAIGLLFCCAAAVFAQQPGGNVVPGAAPSVSTILLRGRALDSSRAPIADASVVAVHEGNAPAISTKTDPNGDFSMALSPGSYRVSVTAPGFVEFSRSVTVAVDSQASEWVLQVAPLRTALTVTESPNYIATVGTSATRTLTPLRDVPQSVSVVTQELIKDQAMSSMADVVRYMPGITAIQGENNRDQLVIRGTNTSADFFLNGIRDDVQYYRDLYNVESVEALKGPNAMIFGRGGGGGVVNRVTKQAGFAPLRELTLQGGSFRDGRMGADLNQPLNDKVAVRLNGMYENSDGFRNFVGLERWAINPTLAFSPSSKTTFMVGYEHLNDGRVADRGIPSFQGRPANTPLPTYFGNPFDSRVRAAVDLGSVSFEHQADRWTLRNRSLFGAYDRGYQNYVPGAVNAAMTQVSLTAYNNATTRENVLNQTDLSRTLSTGRVRHTLLGGIEVGRQITDNFRNSGFFNNTAVSILVPYDNPTISTPVTFRQSATDADNHLQTNLAAVYVQDQAELSRHVQIVAGVRLDSFDLQYRNNRNDDHLRRTDHLVSPRVGVVYKPIVPVSVYWNYSVSYLPSSGDQFSSLTVVTQQVKPETFRNYELGAKWDLNRYLSLTTAAYLLDRTNTRSTDPNNPAAIVQTGSTRNAGYEIALNGNITRPWKVAGGYAYQNSYISGATTAAPAGNQVAQVPHHTFSLWNNYRIIPRLGAGLGIVSRSAMFAAVDNTVVVPGYTRADAALFFGLTERTRFQVNVENLFNTRYYVFADGNNNISPGSTRAVRASLVARF